MDVVAHTLWTNAVFHAKYHHQRRQRYIAAFFGVLPDLVSFVPLSAYLIFHTQEFSPHLFVRNIWQFKYAVTSYNFTHSLVICILVTVIVIVIRHGKIYWPMLGWGFHILLDIPTHKNFFETPFLFPLSNSHNHTYAVSWSEPLFMVINYSALILVYFYIFHYRKRKDKKENP